MNFVVTSSPHIRGKRNTQQIMLDVIIALLPALLAGTIIFGMRALLVAVVCIAAAVAAYEGQTSTDGFVVRSIKKAKRR